MTLDSSCSEENSRDEKCLRGGNKESSIGKDNRTFE